MRRHSPLQRRNTKGRQGCIACSSAWGGSEALRRKRSVLLTLSNSSLQARRRIPRQAPYQASEQSDPSYRGSETAVDVFNQAAEFPSSPPPPLYFDNLFLCYIQWCHISGKTEISWVRWFSFSLPSFIASRKQPGWGDNWPNLALLVV